VRIGIVVPYDLAEEGGVKRHAFHLADAMRRAGDEVEIVGPLSRGAPPPRVRGFGGVVNIPANGSANHMALLVAPWSVGQFLRERRFDIIHLHEPMVPMLSYYALWLSRGSARVATFHMYAEAESGASRTARRALARVLFPALDAGIAVSPAAADFITPLWRRPLRVIPNGVPTGVFTPADPAAPASAEGPLRLLFVGNWRDRRKGLPVLLDAFRLARTRGIALSLDVIGEGQPDSEQLGIAGVTFLGPVASESVLADHYRRCDLFVAPATGQESFGIVLLEAMACGRPVVCSDIRGYRDVIDPAGAQLVPPGDPAALADAIAGLATDRERRRAMAARNRLRAEAFDWARLALEVRAVYCEALESQTMAPVS
jgi:phosphatidylinositol alpha-mannosyltransferase